MDWCKSLCLGIRNPSKSDVNNPRPEDAGEALCGEVWFNEFRLKGFDERGGGAALGSIDVKLADLGTASFSANMHGIGFGQVEQRVDQRLQDKYFQYNFTTSFRTWKISSGKIKHSHSVLR